MGSDQGSVSYSPGAISILLLVLVNHFIGKQSGSFLLPDSKLPQAQERNTLSMHDALVWVEEDV